VAQPSEIAQLAERRRLLVAESARLRLCIDAELANLVPTLNWVERGLSIARGTRTYWPLIAGAAGFLATRKKGGWVRSLGKLWSVWRLARKLMGSWKRG